MLVCAILVCLMFLLLPHVGLRYIGLRYIGLCYIGLRYIARHSHYGILIGLRHIDRYYYCGIDRPALNWQSFTLWHIDRSAFLKSSIYVLFLKIVKTSS